MRLVNQLRKLGIIRILSALKHFNSLRKNNILYKKYGIKKKLWQGLSYNSIPRHSDDFPWMDQPVTTETIQNMPLYKSFNNNIQQQLLLWREKGIIVLPRFFKSEEIDKTERSITTDLTEKNKEKYFSNRVINLHKTNKLVDSLFRDVELLKLLSFILGKEALPYQTINFYKSSSQLAHSDSLHLTTEPLGYLVGVWVALEDVVPGSGEFFYYPGSHKFKYIMNQDFNAKNNTWSIDVRLNEKYEDKVAQVIQENQLKPETFLPKKGDVMIWHANLLHGSHPKKDLSLTRKSLVMHYFAKGVLCYHESMERPVVF
ncbi:MAG: phytanoyl-CoA dioxygenase [Flavisolibacter sp.]|jgi:hypothetical protein|nr:phytanoyl-CoA dioxygenase [Flavisolibacter sp.]